MRIALVTDGACDLSPELATAHGIEIVPHHIHWGSRVYTSGVDLTGQEFYERLAREPVLPKTSQPSPGEFAEKYRIAREKHNADSVLCITASRRITGAHGSALLAREMVDFSVRVVDSNTATVALGLTVLAVADALARRVSLDDAVLTAREAAEHSRFYFTLTTLEFLHRGGRIGGAQRLIGTALNIKPILHVHEGRVDAQESVRTHTRAIARLVEIAATYKDKRPIRLAVIHSNAPEKDEFTRRLRELLEPKQFYEVLASPAVGVYAGPGGLGFGLVYGK